MNAPYRVRYRTDFMQAAAAASCLYGVFSFLSYNWYLLCIFWICTHVLYQRIGFYKVLLFSIIYFTCSKTWIMFIHFPLFLVVIELYTLLTYCVCIQFWYLIKAFEVPPHPQVRTNLKEQTDYSDLMISWGLERANRMPVLLLANNTVWYMIFLVKLYLLMW